MSNRATRRDTCRLCAGRNLVETLALEPTPLGDEFLLPAQLDRQQPSFPLTILLCLDCGHSQLLNVIDPDTIYREYTYSTSISTGLAEHFARYADDLLARTGIQDGLVVELGSNEGAMLRAFQKRGLTVLGVDPARAIAAGASAAGLETLPAYFTAALARELRRERGPARIIVANNVFANIDDLEDAAAGIRELLAADGVFVFESSYFLDVVEHLLLDTIFHEHLSYFAAAPLAAFFRRNGLELVHVQRTGSKGGSLIGTVQLAGGPRGLDPSVPALIERETRAGLFQPGTFAAMAERIDLQRRQLAAALDERQALGGSIAAYGAAVGLTTLIYHFRLGPRLSFIVDDNPGKQGTFSPGLRIPVLAPEALAERNPDTVVLLAWRYGEAILRSQKAYLEGGGRFLVPLPAVRFLP